MPRRSSTGELVPKDISEILAREARAHRGQRKPGGPLGQAFCWLKGSRKKKKTSSGTSSTCSSISNALNGVGTTGTAADTAEDCQNHAPAKAGPRRNEDQKGLSVHYRASQHYPENVFIQGNRSQYLEDLHTEAQQGLKILQQEEHYIDGSFPDNRSVSSTNTLRPDQDVYSLDSGCSPEPGITAGSSLTTLTSARPVLTRQASTFKPLNSTETVKRPDKGRKKVRRTTIMGIPQQVQRELALQRNSTFQPMASPRLTNGRQRVNDGLSGALVIPTVNGETPVAIQEGARVNLSDLEVSREDQLLRKHLQAVYQEEQLSNPQDLGYHLRTTISQRPKSLAVPGMTTSSSAFNFLHEPQGPVMSISPQATYLSKIIPNAVLPASVEVIQINCGGSRSLGGHGGGVRAVSKSSLMSADSSGSPGSSRRSDGDGSDADDAQKSTTALGFRSRSSSAEMMIMPNGSTAERSADALNLQMTIGLTEQGGPSAETDRGHDLVSICSSLSWVSSPGKSQGSDCEASGSASGGEDMRSGHSFTRNLSIVKTKLPPAPPQRTNSLHINKMRKNSKDLLVVKDLTDSVRSGAVNVCAENVPSQTGVQRVISETTRDEPHSISVAVPSSMNEFKSTPSSGSFNPFPDSNSGAGEPSNPPSVSSSSIQKTRSEGSNSERTMSPSSGYSSRSGTPTLSPKGISLTSPDKHTKRPVKPERSGSRASSSPASPSLSLTSLSSNTSDPTNQEVPANIPGPAQQESPPATEKFTQVCFSPSFADREMFNIPPPPKVKAPCAPPPEVWAHNKHSVKLLFGPPSYSTRLVSMKTSSSQTTEWQTEANQGALTVDVIQMSESKEAVSQEKSLLEEILETVSQVLDSREGSHLAPEKVERPTDVPREDQSSSPSKTDTERPEKTLKKQPPPVMKKTIPGTIRDELLSRRKLVEEQQQQPQQAEYNNGKDVCVPRQNPTYSLQPDVQVSQHEVEMVTPTQTLTVETPNAAKKVDQHSPPPSPPPAYHPTPPPSRKTPPSSISTPSPGALEGVQEEVHAVETCWPPPPPPPLEGDMVFDGGDEVDFPPPPPFVTEILPDVIDGCTTATKGPDQPGAALEEAKLTTDNSCSTEGQNEDEEMSNNVSADEGRRPLEGATQYPDMNCTDLETNKLLPDLSSLPKVVPLTPREVTPPLPPITTSEIPLLNPTLVPLSSVCPALLTQTKCPAPTEAHISAPFTPPANIPQASSPPADHKCPSVNFRRQPSLANREARSKEILSRHKSVPIPKEDANIPLVTPSLLQMVRLRTVSMIEDEMSAVPVEDHSMPSNGGLQLPQDNCPAPTSGPQGTPQKPIRKSLSYKSAHTVKTSSVTRNSPSMRLQEAIRMKTAAMSSRDCLPSRLGSRLLMSGGFGESGTIDPLKSPASTASFIFSKSTKKVVIETAASSPEAQAGLKQSLAAELIQTTDRTKGGTVSNGGVKWDKVPPPVAKKPAHGSSAPSNNDESRREVNTEAIGGVTGNIPSSSETTMTTVTPDTIETLF